MHEDAAERRERACLERPIVRRGGRARSAPRRILGGRVLPGLETAGREVEQGLGSDGRRHREVRARRPRPLERPADRRGWLDAELGTIRPRDRVKVALGTGTITARDVDVDSELVHGVVGRIERDDALDEPQRPRWLRSRERRRGPAQRVPERGPDTLPLEGEPLLERRRVVEEEALEKLALTDRLDLLRCEVAAQHEVRVDRHVAELQREASVALGDIRVGADAAPHLMERPAQRGERILGIRPEELADAAARRRCRREEQIREQAPWLVARDLPGGAARGDRRTADQSDGEGHGRSVRLDAGVYDRAVRQIYQRMAQLEREGRRYAVCTVVRTVGSTPQVVGAKMIVDDLGRLTGTLGGGCVEGDAFDEARRVIGTSETSLREYELTEELAWDTGLVCGGTMWIWIEPGERALRVGDRELLGDVLAASTGGRPVERATAAATDALRQGTARTVPLDDAHELLIEPVLAKPRLVVVGGGHVGLAIARMASLLDYEVTVIEDRGEFATRERFPDGVEVMHADMVKALETMEIGWNTFIVVATSGHKLDSHALRAAVRTEARYVGLLGSRRKTILIERMLRDEGIPEERLREVHSPIGLDLGGRTPAEIALSILAELSTTRYGGSARPLRLSGELYERAVAKD